MDNSSSDTAAAEKLKKRQGRNLQLAINVRGVGGDHKAYMASHNALLFHRLMAFSVINLI